MSVALDVSVDGNRLLRGNQTVVQQTGLVCIGNASHEILIDIIPDAYGNARLDIYRRDVFYLGYDEEKKESLFEETKKKMMVINTSPYVFIEDERVVSLLPMG